MKTNVFTAFHLLLVMLICDVSSARAGRVDSHTVSRSRACDKLTSVVQPWVEHGVFQGNLLLTKQDKMICDISVGFSDAKKQHNILTDSRFAIASLSKPIVASLLLKLQEQGILDLQSSVGEYLVKLPASWKHRITLHHLLANRSGLPGHYRLPSWSTRKHQTGTSKEVLLDEIAGMSLEFPPGTDYLYTNLGWTLLVEVVESVTGKSFADNLHQHIFAPLKMRNSGTLVHDMSTLLPPTSLVDSLTWGKKGGWQQSKALNQQIFHGGAGIYSTSHDLARFLSAVHKTDWLSPQSKALMFSSDTPYAWYSENLSLSSEFEQQAISYNGQLQGFSSFVYHLPKEALSLVMLTNTGMGFAHKKALGDDILRAFYDLPLSKSSSSPSLTLNQSLLADDGVNEQWQSSLKSLTRDNAVDPLYVSLLHDLAQQLEWSGNHNKAIDVYAWLVRSAHDNPLVMKPFERLCEVHPSHRACPISESLPVESINVGMTILSLEDPTRKSWRSDSPRPVTTHLFYPTRSGHPIPLMLGPSQSPLFMAGAVVHNAELSMDERLAEKRPLVLMSHGTGGSAPQLLWLAQALVKAGYVVAAVNHHGNTAFEDDKFPEGFLLWWERAQDLQVIRQQLLNNTVWGPHLDENRTALIGFSLGGYTTLSALGAITDKALFHDYCLQAADDFSCQPQPEFRSVLEAFEKVKDSRQVLASQARQHNNYKLPHLKAAVVIAPAVVHAFRPESLMNINTPTLFIVGSKDKVAPAKPNSEYAHALLPNSQFLRIENGHHYSFLSTCTEEGKRILPMLCEDLFGAPRPLVHQQTTDSVVAFLEQNL